MSRIIKSAVYKQLFERLDTARASGFHLEAAWIAYEIIEDRLLSALRQTGGIPMDKKGRPIKMLGPKLDALHLMKRFGTR